MSKAFTVEDYLLTRLQWLDVDKVFRWRSITQLLIDLEP